MAQKGEILEAKPNDLHESHAHRLKRGDLETTPSRLHRHRQYAERSLPKCTGYESVIFRTYSECEVCKRETKAKYRLSWLCERNAKCKQISGATSCRNPCHVAVPESRMCIPAKTSCWDSISLLMTWLFLRPSNLQLESTRCSSRHVNRS